MLLLPAVWQYELCHYVVLSGGAMFFMVPCHLAVYSLPLFHTVLIRTSCHYGLLFGM